MLPAVLAAITIGSAGCSTTKNWFARPDTERPPTGEVCEILPIFQHSVVYSPNLVNDGKPTPCVGGTVYLLGRDHAYPISCNGTMVVELFDDTNPQQPVLNERWELSKEILATRLTHGGELNSFGWGYNLLLPWSNYRPEIQRVHMHIAVKGEKATLPMFRDTEVMTMGDMPQSQQGTRTASGTRSPGIVPAGATAQGNPAQGGAIVHTIATMPAQETTDVKHTDIPLGQRGLRPTVVQDARNTMPSMLQAGGNGQAASGVDLSANAMAPAPQGSGSSGNRTITIPGGGLQQPSQVWPPPGK
jgi:hypothetical protein